jgi:glucokinase
MREREKIGHRDFAKRSDQVQGVCTKVEGSRAGARGRVAVADVGGTRLRVAIFDLQGHMIKRSEEQTPRTDASNAIINAIKSLTGQRGIIAACIGVPGIVIPVEERITYCENVPSLESVALAPLVGEALKVPVTVKNDVGLGAIGEYVYGKYAGADSLVNISIGTGLGCGIVIAGKPWLGAHGLASEIAEWQVLDPWSGDVKRAEDVCSGLALSKRADEILGQSVRRDDLDSSEVLYRAAAEGNEEAKRAFSEVGKALGKIIACIGGLLDPSAVILNGGVMKAGEFILESVYSAYRQASIGPARDIANIAISNLGDLAPLLGGYSSIVTRL